MGIFFINYLYNYKLCRTSTKLKELEISKYYKKMDYKKRPSIKTYREIMNINKQINAINLKSKKKGKSNLINEIDIAHFK